MEWDAPFYVIVAALFVIVMCRANATYWLGRLIQSGARRTRIAHAMSSPGYARAEQQLNKWGPPIISLSFLTIGFQTLVNLAAGATRMPLRRYLPAVTVGSVIWALLYGTVGYVGVESFNLLWARNPTVAVVVAVIAAAALAAFIVWRVRESRRRRPDAAAS
ncbi:hypothetical protein G7070_15450 [Propioniciclava coleopterorum]|uniref:VTT domain-containing protein n=1 Tax=Propioniciclava coleopterorum TaxID=2714937 RepID=A0A6G7YB15_9ACTN|nr:VTT domain-containing protein [Propioniciclava coleopterorum]QIK74012.1 hypothetical protein G7070_15450 [Propioniciclava coleopterorum]